MGLRLCESKADGSRRLAVRAGESVSMCRSSASSLARQIEPLPSLRRVTQSFRKFTTGATSKEISAQLDRTTTVRAQLEKKKQKQMQCTYCV